MNSPILDRITNMNDRQLLMLIDYAMDQMSEDVSEQLSGLRQAFEVVEEGRSYPIDYPQVAGDWKAWNAARNANLARAFEYVREL